MFHRVAATTITKVVVRRGVFNLARALTAAALAGFGWKLGADAYDAVKKRATPPPEFDPEEELDE